MRFHCIDHSPVRKVLKLGNDESVCTHLFVYIGVLCMTLCIIGIANFCSAKICVVVQFICGGHVGR